MRSTMRSNYFGLLAFAAGLGLASPLAAQADDKEAMKKDGMKHEEMAKDDKMAKDAMGPHGGFAGAGDHKAGGSFEIVTVEGKQQVKLSDDFWVDKVPDAYLVLASADQPDGKSVYIAKLKHLKGSQAYDLPKGTDPSGFTRVLLWCKKFSVLIGSADLPHGDMMKKDEMKHDDMKHDDMKHDDKKPDEMKHN
ncbi:MAG: DM13 domain-containing protein [Gemmatimonadales bacterium]